MASVMDMVGGLLTTDNIGKVAKALDLDSAQVQKGMGTSTAAVLGSLTKMVDSKGGIDSLMSMLPTDAGGGGTSDMIGGLLNSISSGGTSADMMNNVMGEGINAISGTLTQKLGFDVKPMLAMAVPLVMGQVNKLVKSGNLDADGLTKELRAENKAFNDNPANKETMDMIQSAFKAGDEAIALKGRFSADDWAKVRGAPAAAVYLVTSASESSGHGKAKELAAAASALGAATSGSAPTSLVGSAFGGGLTQAELDVLKGNRPSRDRLLATIRDGVAAVRATSAGDAASYGAMIKAMARQAAEAEKEGGFLGIGGKQLSDAEVAALKDIEAAIG